MNTASRRFPSITNEDAIVPHEHAFRRWSSPDFGGSAYAAPPMIPDAAPTDRADTMALHHPPTFKVYTPQEVRSVPFRKSMPAIEEIRDTDGIGASTLLKWTGIGIVAGLAVLTALIVALNFGGDRAFAFISGGTSAPINMRSALFGNKAAEATPATPAKAAAVPSTVAEAKPAPQANLDLSAKKPAPTTATKVAPAKTPAKKH